MTESTEPAGPSFHNINKRPVSSEKYAHNTGSFQGHYNKLSVRGDWRETLGPGKKEKENQPITQATQGLTSQTSH